jgi:hypothetical protein
VRLLLAAVALVLSAVSAPAAVEPGPTWNPAPAVLPVLAADERLQQPVSLRLSRASLSAVLAEVSRQCGVSLQAAPEVADEPAVVSIRSRPAAEVLTHLARLFDFQWRAVPGSRGTKGAYQLYQDRGSRQRERMLRQQEEQRALEALDRELRLLFRLARLSPQEIARGHDALEAERRHTYAETQGLSDQERAGRYREPAHARRRERQAARYAHWQLLDPVLYSVMGMLAEVLPGHWPAVRRGRTVIISTRPGAGQDMVALTPEQSRRLRALPPVVPSTRPHLEAFDRRSSWRSAEELQVRLHLEMGREGSALRANLDLSCGALQSENGRDPGFGSHFTITGASRPRGGEPLEASLTLAVPDEWQDDPVLGSRRPLRAGSPHHPWLRWSLHSPPRPSPRTLLPAIAEAWGLDVVADGYRATAFARYNSEPPWPQGEPLPLYQALNRYVLPGANWSREGDVFHVRHRLWHLVRAEEIADRVAERWERKFRDHPQVTLEDAAALTRDFRDVQLERLPFVLRERGVWLGALEWSLCEPSERAAERAALRAYAALSPQQRRALARGAALPVDLLLGAAKAHLEQALTSRVDQRGGSHPRGPGGAVLRLSLLPARRVVYEHDGNFIVDTQLEEEPDTEAEALLWEDAWHQDSIPNVPGLRVSTETGARIALFELVWHSGDIARFFVHLPSLVTLPEAPAGSPETPAPAAPEEEAGAVPHP